MGEHLGFHEENNHLPRQDLSRAWNRSPDILKHPGSSTLRFSLQ